MGRDNNRPAPLESLLSDDLVQDRVRFLVGRVHKGHTGLEASASVYLITKDEEAAAAYRAELEELSFDVMYKLFLVEKAKAEAELEQALFFHRSDAEADFAHYCQAVCWELDECVALSFGKEPRIVNLAAVWPYVKVSDFANRYERRHDLFLRAHNSRALPAVISPSDFVAWAQQYGFALPDELAQGVRDNMSSRKNQTVVNKTSATKMSKNMLRLIGVMAASKYGYETKTGPHGSVATKIKRDFELLGLRPLDDQTILGYLKDAHMLITSDRP